jgi:hypothetical protein
VLDQYERRQNANVHKKTTKIRRSAGRVYFLTVRSLSAAPADAVSVLMLDQKSGL